MHHSNPDAGQRTWSRRTWFRRPILYLLAAGAILYGFPCQAGDWTITPSVSLYQSFTSNASLNPIGQANPDFFTTLVPAVDVQGDTSRIKLNFDYSLDAIAYFSNPQLDQLRSNLNFLSTMTVVPQLFYIDGAASIQQIPSNGQLPVSSSPLAASTNLTTVGSYNISPYIKTHFGSFADSELRYTFNQVIPGSTDDTSFTGSNELSNSITNRLTETLVSGADFTRLFWSVIIDGDNTTFSGSNPDTLSRLVQANGEYRLGRQVGLLASVGYELISDPTFAPEPEPDGPIGSVGIKYTPGPRTSLIVNLNHRYNSNFVTGSGSYLIGAESRVDAAYTDQVYTSSQSLFSNNLSFLTTDQFGNFIDSRTEQLFSLSGTNLGFQSNAFRLKTFNLGLHAVEGRNTFDVGGFWQNRDVFQTGEVDTAFGGGASWGRALSPVAKLTLSLRYANQQFDIPLQESDQQQLIGAGGSLVYNLNDTLDGVLTLNYTRQFANISTNAFEETVLSVGLQKHF